MRSRIPSASKTTDSRYVLTKPEEWRVYRDYAQVRIRRG